MMTLHEAQLYLAVKLPERIELLYGIPYWKHPCPQPPHILETEWQQIALWVEEKMTDEQYYRYVSACHIAASLHEDNYQKARNYLSANYITRATAMKESGL